MCNYVLVNGVALEQVDHFKYLGSTMNEDITSKEEVRCRLGAAMSSLAKLDKIWRSKTIHFPNKLNLLNAIVSAVALYGCESWTLNKKLIKQISAFENKCYRRLLGINWKEKKANEFVQQKVKEELGKEPEKLIDKIWKWKLNFFGHTIGADRQTKIIIQGKVEGERPRRQ